MRFRNKTNIEATFQLDGQGTVSTGHLKFTPDAVSELQAGFSGDLTLQSSPNYDNARQMFVPTYQFYPQIIAYCHVESDVVKALAFARKYGLHPVCRSGGHSTAGFSANDEMVIDMSNVSYVTVDMDSMTMRVGGGTIFARINPMMEHYGVNITGGGCATVSVGGYMQGGGYGFTALTNGMNCDCVKEFRMALASGEVVTANASEHPDLFWAVRGGTGSNFGVLLEVTYNVRKDISAYQGFGMRWPLGTPDQNKKAAEAMKLWYDGWTGECVPEHLGHQMPITFWNDKPYLFIRGMYEGPKTEAEILVEPFKALMEDPATQMEFWAEGSYTYLNEYLLSQPTELPTVPMSSRSVNTSRIFGDGLALSDFEDIITLFLKSPVRTNMFLFEPYGGAINKVDSAATAFVHRNARFDLALYSFWIYTKDMDPALTYLASFEDTLTPMSTGHAYQNYPNRRTQDYATLYWGDNLERLKKVKKQYDPADFFNFPQSVPVD